MKKLVFFVYALILSLNLFAQTTYTFHTAGNWTDQANWSPSYPGFDIQNSIININAYCTFNSSYNSINLTNVTLNINNTFDNPAWWGGGISINNSQVNILNTGIWSLGTPTWWVGSNSGLNNYGNLIVSVPSITTSFLNFNNYGTCIINSFLAIGELWTENALFTNFGLVNINQAGAIGLSYNGQIINSGSLIFNSGGLYIDGSGSILSNNIISGTCEIYKFICNVCNINMVSSSFINPGSPTGVINIWDENNTCINVPIYNADINGIIPEIQYDQLNFFGCANILNATLNVTWGFTPSAGQEFTILTYESKVGEFNSVNIPPISGLNFTVQYNSDNTKIIVSSALPLTLLDFEAQKISDRLTKLSWQTENEKDISSFNIQHSQDAKAWTSIGVVPANNEQSAGVNSYNFVDESPDYGINYYRLAIKGYDGEVEYSPVRSVYFGDDQDDFQLLGHDKMITIASDTKKNKLFLVYNSIGLKVAASSDTNIPVPSSGIYLVSDGINTKKVFVR